MSSVRVTGITSLGLSVFFFNTHLHMKPDIIGSYIDRSQLTSLINWGLMSLTFIFHKQEQSISPQVIIIGGKVENIKRIEKLQAHIQGLSVPEPYFVLFIGLMNSQDVKRNGTKIVDIQSFKLLSLWDDLIVQNLSSRVIKSKYYFTRQT
ncbi:hypothetical protein ACJX0J_021726 [Zea mays]